MLHSCLKMHTIAKEWLRREDLYFYMRVLLRISETALPKERTRGDTLIEEGSAFIVTGHK